MASLAEILQRQSVWRGGAPSGAAVPAAPTGYAALDAALPGGGWPAGGLAELLCRAEGVGELQVVLPALAALTAAGHRVAWLAPPYLPYAPALKAAGVRLAGLTVVRAPGRRDALWAAEQALRSGAFHALLLWLPKASYPELRRLAVAAQAGPGFALAFRPQEAGCESSPAVLRLALEPAADAAGPPALRILKRRGMPLAAPLSLPLARPLPARPAHALGRAPLSAVPATGARARACAA
ncbi:MAG TPA: translesion DNA synthesis-associated protein ImuA [Burkholderiales bacterium]|nr:translesion DNA synthesis-associated protein ImuA [Burkholderiales bacterium]